MTCSRVIQESQALAALDFVEWDRFTEDCAEAVVYGWIRRDDGRDDFVVVHLNDFGIGFVTSSAKFSEEISVRLGGDGTTHDRYVPLETLPELTWLSNVIRTGRT